MPQLDSSLLTLNTSAIAKLSSELTASLRKPSRRTLALIDKALSYLTPFESPKASVTSASEKKDLLDLLNIHRMVLLPYLDTDRIERNLRYGAAVFPDRLVPDSAWTEHRSACDLPDQR